MLTLPFSIGSGFSGSSYRNLQAADGAFFVSIFGTSSVSVSNIVSGVVSIAPISDRVVILPISYPSGPVTTSLTVNGVAATRIIDNRVDGPAYIEEIWACPVGIHDDAGANGNYDVVFNFSGPQFGNIFGDVYEVEMDSIVAHNTLHQSLTTPVNTTSSINIPAKGFGIAFAVDTSNNATPFVKIGTSTTFNENSETTYLASTPGISGGLVITWDQGGSGSGYVVFASWLGNGT